MDGKKRGETKHTQKIGKTNETKWASKSSSITRLQDHLEDLNPEIPKKQFSSLSNPLVVFQLNL
jgi:hypothetical protein